MLDKRFEPVLTDSLNSKLNLLILLNFYIFSIFLTLTGLRYNFFLIWPNVLKRKFIDNQ